MASNTTIGEVTKYDLLSDDQLGNLYVTYLNKNGLQINPNATYANVNTASRALAAISTNTYNNTFLTTNIKLLNSTGAVGNAQSLYLNSADEQEKAYQTLVNVGETRINPDVEGAHIYTYLGNAFRNLSTNTVTSINTITIIDVNEQMAS